MKKIIILLLTVIFLLPQGVYAQQSTSNSVITQFGNAPQDQKPQGANTDLSKAAQNLITAYSACPPAGKSDFVNDNRTKCLKTFLKTLGYPDDVLTAFGLRRSTSNTDASCAECLGFVALALTLTSGDSNALLGSPIESSNIPNPAYIYNKLSQFPVGKLAYSVTGRMEEGAVGIGIPNLFETIFASGHALIVKKVVATDKFLAYESSYGPICSVTDDKPHVKEAYKFYNK